MLGAIILAVILVVVFPVATLMGGAVASAVMGFLLKTDADDRAEGSELLESNY